MPIRSRLVVAAVQLVVLVIGDVLVTGEVSLTQTWFAAGILMVILSRQLNEPFFSRPADAITGAVTSLIVVAAASRNNGEAGWTLLASYLFVGLIVAVMALAFGAGRTFGRGIRIGRTANQLVQLWQGRISFSLTFLVAAFEGQFVSPDGFLQLVGLGALVLAIGSVRWDKVFQSASGISVSGQVVGLLAPSRLLVSSTSSPEVGQTVRIKCGELEMVGHVLGRTRRLEDVWCEIETGSPEVAEEFVGKSVAVSIVSGGGLPVLGAIETGSSDQTLVFITTQPVELGATVVVHTEVPDSRVILFQVTEASVLEESPAERARHQVVRVIAKQLGYVDPQGRLNTHRWSPTPGLLVRGWSESGSTASPPDDWMCLGHVLGSSVPVYLDLPLLMTGHTAILGMTKMGKTTLTFRFAEELGKSVPVVILDQTGEYVGKRGVPAFTTDDLSTPGVTVYEVGDDTTAPAAALKALTKLQELGRAEYIAGALKKRVLILEEAHQFIPEPAMLGFGAPGREEAIKLGLLMMQVRKYGISIVLVSQRTAVVAKSALSQCENLFAFRSVDQTGLDYLEAVGGPHTRDLLPRLRQGEIVAMGPAVSSDNAVAIMLPLE